MRNIVLKLAALALVLTLAAPAKISLADGIQWIVRPDFKNDDAALEISGAVCAGKNGDWCFAVNDEKKYVQAFSMGPQTLIPGDRLRVLPKKDSLGEKFDEPDIEAITYGSGFVYLAGSHGLSRKKHKRRPSVFFVYRFPVDPENGEPGFELTRDDLAPEIERSDKLGAIIMSADHLSDFAEKKLKDNGANIEGMAIRNDSLFFGFRGPVHEHGAVVLEVKAGRVFGDLTDPAISHVLDLGAGYGVRGMTTFGDGFLVLAGAVGSEAALPAIWYWKPGQHPRLLKILPVPGSSKAEGLMIVDEKNNKQELRVVVLFDSQKNGAPAEFTVPAP